ncbi:AAA family ATPase [Herbiconiux liangxiaofengii]|uniref:AAA family ATPase n=1 Tax=Herbiconiux liangxiaofengii TaxID=3342795 RepID=UPI0035B8F0F2
MTPPAPSDDDWLNDSRAIRRVSFFADAPAVSGSWPMTVPAVASLRDGFELPPGVTFLVGENGSGKSTVLEGIAEAFGFPAEGGSRHGGGSTRRSESPLGEWLKLERGVVSPKWGFFLRAETMHGYFSYLDGLDGSPDADLHEMSHGESFLALLERKIDSPGFFCLDEPEAALSFQSTLRYLAQLDSLAKAGAQIVCATHSPVLASLPGATILEFGDWGIRNSAWDDLELVTHWRNYLDAPGRYLRHLLD